jgi:hypothetical protein
VRRERQEPLRKRIVDFIDTSVLVEILGVPGKSQHRAQVLDELSSRIAGSVKFVLPTATIIETGNHVFQLADGGARRCHAESFVKLLRMTANREAPWVLHERTWSSALLHQLCDGGSTGMGLAEHATCGLLGTGDLPIVVERDLYAQNADADVRIWTLENCMQAWALTGQPPAPKKGGHLTSQPPYAT